MNSRVVLNGAVYNEQNNMIANPISLLVALHVRIHVHFKGERAIMSTTAQCNQCFYSIRGIPCPMLYIPTADIQ